MPPSAGNMATAAASALAAGAVKAKVGVYVWGVVFIGSTSSALGLSRGEAHQEPSGPAGGDPDEEAGDQAEAFRGAGGYHGPRERVGECPSWWWCVCVCYCLAGSTAGAAEAAAVSREAAVPTGPAQGGRAAYPSVPYPPAPDPTATAPCEAALQGAWGGEGKGHTPREPRSSVRAVWHNCTRSPRDAWRP